jgi:hypothetical protein
MSSFAFVGRWPEGARFFMNLVGPGMDESSSLRAAERRDENSRKMYQTRQQAMSVTKTVAP